VEIGAPEPGLRRRASRSTMNGPRPRAAAAAKRWHRGGDLRRYRAFIADGELRRPELWALRRDGTAAHAGNWIAPLYLGGARRRAMVADLRRHARCARRSRAATELYESADAYARWAGARPADRRWRGKYRPAADAHAGDRNLSRRLVSPIRRLVPVPGDLGLPQLFGDVWEWTPEPVPPYPDFARPPASSGSTTASNVQPDVLRGGFLSDAAHARAREYVTSSARSTRWQSVGHPPSSGSLSGRPALAGRSGRFSRGPLIGRDGRPEGH